MNRIYSNNRNPRYQNNRSCDYSNNRSKYNSYQNRSRDNSQNRNSSYIKRQRNYSQSPHRNNTRYQNSPQNYRSSTPKHQRQTHQVESTEGTQPDPPSNENNESTELQLNHKNGDSMVSKSDTENTISNNMINVENDYEPIIYEQPIFSHIYQNHDPFLLNYYTRPVSKSTTKKTEKTVEEIKEEKPTECSSTNNIYQNIPKEPHVQKEKIWTTPLLLESPKSKQVQTPDLEIDFLIDFGAESTLITIPTWNEIRILHPKLIPFKITSRPATKQGTTLTNYGKIQLFLVPTRTMEQKKLISRPFKQTFHITDIKQNIIGIPIITTHIPTINILNSRIHIKDKYTRMKNTALTFIQRKNKQPLFFSKLYPVYNQERKHLKPLSGNVYNFSIKQIHQNDKEQIKQHLFMSDLEFRPIHKIFRVTISSIKYMKDSNYLISLYIYNNSPYIITLPLGLLGYCETNTTISSTKNCV